jgi:hypothetical protein
MHRERLLPAALLTLAALAPAGAVELRSARPTPAALAAESPVIVHGTVAATRSEWNESRDFIWTFVTLNVAGSTKGAARAGQAIEIRIPNGEVDGIRQRSSNQVVFDPGEEVVVFLAPDVYRGRPGFVLPRLGEGKRVVRDGTVDGVPLATFLGALR